MVILKLYHRKCIFALHFSLVIWSCWVLWPVIAATIAILLVLLALLLEDICTSSQQQSKAWERRWEDTRGFFRGSSPQDFSLFYCSTGLQPSMCCSHTWSQFGHQTNGALCEPSSSLCCPSVKADEKEGNWGRSCCSCKTRDAGLAVML